jgi:hypothetical protein
MRLWESWKDNKGRKFINSMRMIKEEENLHDKNYLRSFASRTKSKSEKLKYLQAGSPWVQLMTLLKEIRAKRQNKKNRRR